MKWCDVDTGLQIIRLKHQNITISFVSDSAFGLMHYKNIIKIFTYHNMAGFLGGKLEQVYEQLINCLAEERILQLIVMSQ